jgi:hypothetical protein
MSILPFDIIALIIDNVEENKDTNLLKELALVSHSFLQICSKHLFATVELHDAVRMYQFVKLLESRPYIVQYIRKLTYKVAPAYSNFGSNGLLPVLSPILPNFLRTISRLNCLTIIGSERLWNMLDSSLTSAFLHLMHLPTINHLDLSYIQNFPLSSLTPSVNLHRLDISNLWDNKPLEEDGSPELVLSEMLPKIREFHTSESSLLTTKLLHAKRQDGRPAFNFMDLRQLSMVSNRFEDVRNIRYLLQNAKLLEKLDLSADLGFSGMGLHLSPTLKVLNSTVLLYNYSTSLPLAGLCKELEAMAGHNMLEALSLEISIDGYETKDFMGFIFQKVEEALVKPGWSTLRQVSFKVSIACCFVSRGHSAKLCEELQSLPDKYLGHLSKLESVAFNYSANVGKCVYHDHN